MKRALTDTDVLNVLGAEWKSVELACFELGGRMGRMVALVEFRAVVLSLLRRKLVQRKGRLDLVISAGRRMEFRLTPAGRRERDLRKAETLDQESDQPSTSG